MIKTPAEINGQAVARKAFLLDERAREAARRIDDEAKYRTALRAKTARLRALREARDAARHQTETNTSPVPKREPRARRRK